MLPQVNATDPIDVLGLSARLRHVLSRYRIRTVGALVQAVASGDLINIWGVGEKGLAQINERLSEVTVAATPFSEKQPVQTTRITIPAYTPKADEEANLGHLQLERMQGMLREVIDVQTAFITRQVEFGLLHWDCNLNGKTLKEWETRSRNEITDELIGTFAKILTSTINLTDELNQLLATFVQKHLFVLVSRYGVQPKTLAVIGSELGVTRERVRQLGIAVERDILSALSRARSTVRLQTALLLAKEMADDLSFDQWKSQIYSIGLLGDWEKSRLNAFDPLEITIAIANIVKDNDVSNLPLTLSIPPNLIQAIRLAAEGRTAIPVRQIDPNRALPRQVIKQLRRNLKFAGAISAKWLSGEANITMQRLREYFDTNGFVVVSEDWYMLPANAPSHNLGKYDVFHNALHKMFLYCGPLGSEDICSGLRHAISKTVYPVAPPAIMKEILAQYGYSYEDELFYSGTDHEVELSESEKLILSYLGKVKVAHHAELAQIIIDSSLSFPTLHATLKRSPLFERFKKGLYRIRGSKVTASDIVRAGQAAERVDTNVEVNYSITGNIEVSINLGILAIAIGELTSNFFDNLSGDWLCYVGTQQFRSLKVTAAQVKGLQKPLQILDCQVGDRIMMCFDTSIRSVEILKV